MIPSPDDQVTSNRESPRAYGRWIAVTAFSLCIVGGFAVLLPPRDAPEVPPPHDRADGSLFARTPIVQRNPNDAAPLAALIEFTTRQPVTASVEVDDGERQWSYSPPASPQTDHCLVVLGLRPGRDHHIRVRVESEDGQTAESSESFVVTMPALPDDFPPIETLVSRPEKMEPGVTVFPVGHWRDDEEDVDYGYLIALDERGEVVWYLQAGLWVGPFQVLRGGGLLYADNRNFRDIFEVDALGDVVHHWYAANLRPPPDASAVPVAADTFHHEVRKLASGNVLTLATELRQVEDFPASDFAPDAPPGPAHVVGDVILEFRPDGTVVRRWSLFDLLDLQRIGYGLRIPLWDKIYSPDIDAETNDWSHANAVLYDAESDSLLVSLRHQDCLIKIDAATSETVWILGDPSGWREPWSKRLLRPVGDLQWPYHQHGPKVTPHGTILLFDNGNFRARPFDRITPAEENFSRVAEFRVDEDAMTVSQVWEYRGEEGETFYSPFYGEVDWLPQTGNVLITDGGRVERADGTPTDAVPAEHQWARIVEVTHARPAEKVFEVVIDSGRDSPHGWSVFRSQRIPSVQHLAE